MSVIGNALKAAQKEKQRKTGGGPPPVLVPLRSKPAGASSFSWRRALMLGLGGAAVFAATVLTVKMMKGGARAGPVPAPIILGDATPAAADSVVAADSVTAIVPAPSRTIAKAPPVSSPARTTKRVQSKATAAAAAAQPSTPRPRADSAAGLRIAVEAAREDAAQLFAAAVAAHREGNLAYARTAYERVLVMAPGDVDAMNNLAVLLLARRELDAAERLLRRAVALAPRNVGVWSNLGTVLRERGQSADAIAAFQHALSIDPTHLPTRISLAQQFFAIGSYPQARQILDRVVAENPAVPEAQYALGQVLEQQGDIPGAIRAYTTFVRVAPSRFATHVEFVRRRIDELGSRNR
jgi:tetratricopeptide (TPR) repeat protein